MRVRFRAINVKHGVGADTRTVFPRAVYDELGSLTVVQYRPRGEKETIDRIDTPSAATKAFIFLLLRNCLVSTAWDDIAPCHSFRFVLA